MMMRTCTTMGAALVAALFAGSAAALPKCKATVNRDVVIVGGGAAGSHAAVMLRDAGHSVVVVEKASQLGGHTGAYTDPATGKVLNVGVQTWIDYKNAYDFPKRMNVSTSGSMSFTANTASFVDMTTGKVVSDYAAPAAADMYPALARYLAVLEKYEDMVTPGFDNFPAADAIPEDLTMTFAELVEKYDLNAAVAQIWDSTAMGIGNTMDVPAVWVFQASCAAMVKALLGQAAAAIPASGRLYDLYDSVATFLGSDVMYSSTVTAASRNDTGVQVVVKGADGATTHIAAKKLLFAVEPTAQNIAPFDIDATEHAVFDKFAFSTVYAGYLRHPALNNLTAYSNRGLSTFSSNYTVFPEASMVGSIAYVGGTEDLYQFTAVGTTTDTADSMKKLIASTIQKMISSGVASAAASGNVEFSAFANHGHMHPRVTADELKAGFVQRQLALQGRRSTFFTGAAFSAGFSTVIWEYNKIVLPTLIAGL